ncbi:hypothetical protein [Actinomadura nitritigenes]|uniref:hypothetical protein n=1 Tax=Actinomadura nitritigenes TaxID=134602 RepID=UPI003D8E86F4
MSARRAPRPEDRGRATEQTRERILDAAMAEFGAKSYAYLDTTLDRPDWARRVVWQALGDCPFTDAEEGERYAQPQRTTLAQAVQRIREHRDAGEVTDGIDPQFALLIIYAVVFSPITLPHFVRELPGDDPLSPAVRRRLHDQLIKLLGAAERWERSRTWSRSSSGPGET